jgi:hypothetical protein
MRFPEWLPVYGDQDYRNKKCPVESAEQITFFNTLRRDYPELGRIAIHPRNEGKRTANQTQRQKAEGMTAGAADIIIPGSPAFVCELKRIDHTLCAWEPDQLEYLATAQTMGAFVCVALGHKAALEALEVWIGRK